MKVESYLFFDGRCEEAVEFYRSALGAEVLILARYKDSPEPAPPDMMKPGFENKVMHASLRIGDTRVMAADDCQGHPNFQGFSLCVEPADEAQAKKIFAALADGGEVGMPLAPRRPCGKRRRWRMAVTSAVKDIMARVRPEPCFSSTRGPTRRIKARFPARCAAPEWPRVYEKRVSQLMGDSTENPGERTNSA